MPCFRETNTIHGIILQVSPVFTFANQAGLDMLETTLVALQDIMLDKILDEAGRKSLCSEFSKIMRQVKIIQNRLSSNIEFLSKIKQR